MNRELSDVQAECRRGRGSRDQIANIRRINKKAREFQKNIYFCFFDCVDHNKVWKILQEMGIPDYLTCLFRNLCAGQEATVRTGHVTKTGSKQEKEYVKADGSEVKASACNAGDLGSIPGSGRSPGEGNGNPLQYSCLENPMDRGVCWATVPGGRKSWA